MSVSEIGLGTWGMSGAFWGAADDAESIRVIHRRSISALPSSTRLKPTGGALPRRWLARRSPGRRDRAVIATKAAPNHLEPAEAVKALEGSLKRLQTDQVDVYFIHWPNPDVPIGATMDAFERLRARGTHPGARRLEFRPEGDGSGAAAWNHRRAAAAL